MSLFFSSNPLLQKYNTLTDDLSQILSIGKKSKERNGEIDINATRAAMDKFEELKKFYGANAQELASKRGFKKEKYEDLTREINELQAELNPFSISSLAWSGVKLLWNVAWWPATTAYSYLYAGLDLRTMERDAAGLTDSLKHLDTNFESLFSSIAGDREISKEVIAASKDEIAKIEESVNLLKSKIAEKKLESPTLNQSLKTIDLHIIRFKSHLTQIDQTLKSGRGRVGDGFVSSTASVGESINPMQNGYPNLGFTCYLNSVLKAFFFNEGVYSTLLTKDLHQKTSETYENFQLRQNLQQTLRHLVQETRHPSLNHQESIRGLLRNVADHRLLQEVIPSNGRGGYQFAEALALKSKIFDLLESDNDPQFCLHLHSEQREIGGDSQSSNFESVTNSIELTSGGETIQERIDSFLAEERMVDDENLWESPNGKYVSSTKRHYFTPDTTRLPERITFQVNPRVNEWQPLSEIEDRISLPFCNKEGQLVGYLIMDLQEVVCTIPDSHFYSYLKTNDEWHEHNDSFVTPVSRDEIDHDLRRHANMLNYRVVGVSFPST